MKHLSNNVARNAMLFGHATQKHCLTEKKKVTANPSDVQKSNRAPAKSATTGKTNIMDSYLKEQENVQNFQTKTGIHLPEHNAKESYSLNGILNESIFKRKEQKSRQKAPTPDNCVFNVLGLFKPGEILNSIEKQDEQKNNFTSSFSFFA